MFPLGSNLTLVRSTTSSPVYSHERGSERRHLGDRAIDEVRERYAIRGPSDLLPMPDDDERVLLKSTADAAVAAARNETRRPRARVHALQGAAEIGDALLGDLAKAIELLTLADSDPAHRGCAEEARRAREGDARRHPRRGGARCASPGVRSAAPTVGAAPMKKKTPMVDTAASASSSRQESDGVATVGDMLDEMERLEHRLAVVTALLNYMYENFVAPEGEMPRARIVLGDGSEVVPREDVVQVITEELSRAGAAARDRLAAIRGARIQGRLPGDVSCVSPEDAGDPGHAARGAGGGLAPGAAPPRARRSMKRGSAPKRSDLSQRPRLDSASSSGRRARFHLASPHVGGERVEVLAQGSRRLRIAAS